MAKSSNTGYNENAHSTRVGLFDEIRGFAIICMVVYHAMYDLKFLHGIDVPLFFEGWFDIIRDIFAGAFMFISGTVCRYSSSNLKRGVQCFFIGMIMTFVLPFFTNGTILFGILHFMGVCMMLYGLGEKLLDKLPALVGIIICVFLFIFTMNIGSGYIGIGGLSIINIPQVAYDVGILFPLGMHNAYFYSSDYFPLLPWMFVFFAGSYFGVYAKKGQLPKWCYNTHIKWLATVGKYTIWIYILHQPILYFLFNLIF